MRRTLLAMGTFGLLSCGAPPLPPLASLDAANAVKARALTAQPAMPDAIKEGDNEAALARKAQSDGDMVLADLYAERAMAAYARAEAISRLARAEKALVDHGAALEKAETDRRAFHADRIQAEAKGAELERELILLKDSSTPESSAKADPKREAARLVAAGSLALDARLLCSAAKLAGAPADALNSLEGELATLERSIETRKASGGPAIDSAGRLRAKCLTLLTSARRASAENSISKTDALLSEISASALGRFLPSRDERGVVVRISAAPSDAKAVYREVAQVSKAHPEFPLQVVQHDATATPNESKRLDAIVSLLIEAGVDRSRIASFSAGTRAPLTDPADASKRAQNARVEIVFVSTSGG